MSLKAETEHLHSMSRVRVRRDYERDQIFFVLDGEVVLRVTLTELEDSPLPAHVYILSLHAKLEIAVRAGDAKRAIDRMICPVLRRGLPA